MFLVDVGVAKLMTGIMLLFLTIIPVFILVWVLTQKKKADKEEN